ncbi:hypothetical protein D7Z96_16165 [Pseudarthrobacter phenanthrenivorans]|uniref:Uncharacterized protein n=1 Tax=Pseudarthrobacter phenanthrenivorans TaxID=361575 RepID=A0A3B0FNZ5_PSEPS|nr:hypothetical protein [Pseudarthrobacter phenanthrenivorans]RKO21620.1 hypothetical protein D7Z96_16165 [Pseudarthrobacter phenanthrenivorans]
MGFDPHEPEQRNRLGATMTDADITVGELWLRYFGMGGSAGEYEVNAYLQGLISLPVPQRDLLAMAANELVDESPEVITGEKHPLLAPYADQLSGPAPGDGPERA